ncbi:Probable serine/threonine-protein kinase pbl7 [Dionaea muscipula]
MLQARPMFKDRGNLSKIADPALEGQYPSRDLYQALSIAAMCVREQPNLRPVIADVVTALTYLASKKDRPQVPLQTIGGRSKNSNLFDSPSSSRSWSSWKK